MKLPFFKLPRFTKDRREGIARSMDNMGTTAVVALFVGIFRPATMSAIELTLLLIAGLVSYTLAFFIRGD